MFNPPYYVPTQTSNKILCPVCGVAIGMGEMALEFHGPVLSAPLTYGPRTGRIMASDTSNLTKRSEVNFIGHAECFLQFLEQKLYEDEVFDESYTPQYLCAHCGDPIEITLCPSCTDDIYGLTCVQCGNNSREVE